MPSNELTGCAGAVTIDPEMSNANSRLVIGFIPKWPFST
jgi:hypothetical protein